MRIERKKMFWIVGGALLLVACLGIGAYFLFFSSPAAKQSYYDLTVRSELGLDVADVKAIRGLRDVAYAEGMCIRQTEMTTPEQKQSMTVVSISNQMTALTLTSGRMPEQAEEMVITEAAAQETGWKLGTTVTLPDGDFQKTEVVVVGTVEDRWEQGQVYLPLDNFMDKTFDTVLVFAKGTMKLEDSSSEYTAAVNAAAAGLESIRQDRQQKRYEAQREIINQMIAEENNLSHVRLDPVREELEKAKEELDQAGAELESKRKELDEGKKTLDANYAKANAAEAELRDARERLEQTAMQISDAKELLDAALDLIARGEQELASAKQEYQANLAAAGVTDANVESAFSQATREQEELQRELDDANGTLSQANEEVSGLEGQISSLDGEIAGLESSVPSGETPEEIQADEMRIQGELSQLRARRSSLEAALPGARDAAQAAELRVASLESSVNEKNDEVMNLGALVAMKRGIAEGENALVQAQSTLVELQGTLESGMAEYTAAVEQLAVEEDEYNSVKNTLDFEAGKYNGYLKEFNEKDAEYQKARKEFNDKWAQFERQEQEDGERIKALTKEMEAIQVPQWIVEKRIHE